MGIDVAIVGFNDITIARDLPVPLSTVRSPLAQMGSEAAQMLIARLRGEAIASPRHHRLPTARRSGILGSDRSHTQQRCS